MPATDDKFLAYVSEMVQRKYNKYLQQCGQTEKEGGFFAISSSFYYHQCMEIMEIWKSMAIYRFIRLMRNLFSYANSINQHQFSPLYVLLQVTGS